MGPALDSDSTLTRAFETLSVAPTRAPLTLTPDTDVPDGAGLSGWHPVTRLTRTPFVAELAAAYSADLATDHLAVGGACGLQHYAGRYVLAALGAWVQTGALPDPDHAAWRVLLDDAGHTLSVAPPVLGSRAAADPDGAASVMLGEHLGPIVAAARAATRITERVAHGCVAASCSGAFATLHRRTAPHRQGELAELAARFMAAPAWRATRPLVDLHEIQVETGCSLVHERRVCCLIRLGRGHGACGTCPDLDATERRRRTTDHANRAERGTDLPLGVLHVP